MNIIKPYYEIIGNVNEVDTLTKLEKIIRVCYKSEDKITDTSKYDFLAKIVERKHHAMLEHSNFTFSINDNIYYNYLIHSDLVKWMKTSTEIKLINNESIHGVVTLSARSILDLIASEDCYLQQIGLNIVNVSSISLKDKCILFGVTDAQLMDVNKHLDIFEITDEIKNKFISKIEYLKHSFMSIKFVCDRGVSHELVRHRCSFAQESTRYCNYSKDKFGKEITVIKPIFYEEGTELYDNWYSSCESDESTYFWLLENGSTPQEARANLPNSLKTEIVVTMALINWNHFFHMRVPKTAHPQMRELTIPLYKELTTDINNLFDEIDID